MSQKTRTTARTVIGLLAALGLVGALTMPALAADPYKVWLQESHQGADSETFQKANDCGGIETGVVWHFVLNQYDGDDTAHIVATFETAGVVEADASKEVGVQHFFVSTPGHDVLTDAYAEVASDPGSANLVLSHVCDTGNRGSTPTPVPTPDENDDDASLNILKFVEGTRTRLAGAVFEIEGMDGTFTTDENGQICITGLPADSVWLVREIQAPAGYEIIEAEQMVEVDDDGDCDSPDARFYNRVASATPTPSPTPGENVQEGTPTPTPAGEQGGPTPTPREDVQGGNPTPAPSGGELPDTAISSFGQVPATVLSLVLLGALAAMVYARLARQR